MGRLLTLEPPRRDVRACTKRSVGLELVVSRVVGISLGEIGRYRSRDVYSGSLSKIVEGRARPVASGFVIGVGERGILFCSDVDGSSRGNGT